MDEQVIMHKGMRFDRKVIAGILEGNKEEAEEILGDKDKLEEFLQRLEEKMRDIPSVGEFFADVVVLVSLVHSYAKKEYDALPVGTMIAVVSALIYFLSPVDIFPDNIPALGFVDDAAVVMFCMKLASVDIEPYLKWREENGKVYEL